MHLMLDMLEGNQKDKIVEDDSISDVFNMRANPTNNYNPLARSGSVRQPTKNRLSAPLGGLLGFGMNSAAKKTSNFNNLAQSQRTDGMESAVDWAPPANDFYNRAARLSVWSRSDDEGEQGVQIIDGHSSENSADVSIRRLSDNDSFAGSQRSRNNSIAGMSRGSMNSSGSKGIRNFLGSKFNKRANSIA